jgi:hypothetical protein
VQQRNTTGPGRSAWYACCMLARSSANAADKLCMYASDNCTQRMLSGLHLTHLGSYIYTLGDHLLVEP